MEELVKKSCEDFAEQLAAKEPVPGGGGAAALVGALGISLASMVGEYTLGKKKYQDVEPEIRSLLEEAKELRQHLLHLIDQDASAFEPLSKVYAIPKDTPGREKMLQDATEQAIVAPMEMLSDCCKAIQILRKMQLKGSVLLRSDAGCGAALCEAALQAAAINVYVNTKSLKDQKKIAAYHQKVQCMLDEAVPLAKEIVADVTAELKA